MMNSDSTHKVVVGILLAVVLGVGLSVFAVRAKHDSEIARIAPAPAELAPADQNATDEAASAPSAAQMPSDETAAASSAPPTAPNQPSRRPLTALIAASPRRAIVVTLPTHGLPPQPTRTPALRTRGLQTVRTA